MNRSLEDDLRALFAEDAECAEGGSDVADLARRAGEIGQSRLRTQRRQRRTLTFVVAASAVAVAATGTWAARLGDQQQVQVRDSGTPASVAPPMKAGAIPGYLRGRCTLPYSPANVARVSQMAFDGKVVSIAPAKKAGGEDDNVYALVTFAVSEWFAGGQGDTAIVEVLRPDLDIAETAKLEPFAVGDRLLISGGLPDDASKTSVPVAAGCDFSRFYDGSTATLWRDAFR